VEKLDEHYNGRPRAARKKSLRQGLSNPSLSTSRCEQIVHKGGQASDSTAVLLASPNCLKRERRKKILGNTSEFVLSARLARAGGQSNPAPRLETTANQTRKFLRNRELALKDRMELPIENQ
jgi:hypothetical protein